jgi:YggT family protein
LIAAGTLIIHLVFDAYIVILLLRLLLQKLGASWRNPLSQFIIQLTEKPLKPFRKIAPGVARFDLSILLLAIILQFIEVALLWALQFGPIPNLLGTLVITISEIFSKFVYIYIYAIIINALASWFPQTQTHPIAHIVYIITEPVLAQIRRFIPLIAGIDISPMLAIVIFTLINMLIVVPLSAFGTQMIMG